MHAKRTLWRGRVLLSPIAPPATSKQSGERARAALVTRLRLIWPPAGVLAVFAEGGGWDEVIGSTPQRGSVEPAHPAPLPYFGVFASACRLFRLNIFHAFFDLFCMPSSASAPPPLGCTFNVYTPPPSFATNTWRKFWQHSAPFSPPNPCPVVRVSSLQPFVSGTTDAPA